MSRDFVHKTRRENQSPQVGYRLEAGAKGEAPDITYVSGALGSDEKGKIRHKQVKLATFVEFLKGRLKGGQSDGRWCFRSGYFGKGKLKEPQG